MLRLLKPYETRIKIIDLLLIYYFCVGALSRKLGISEASVSQHLKVLRKAGLDKMEYENPNSDYFDNKHNFAFSSAFRIFIEGEYIL